MWSGPWRLAMGFFGGCAALSGCLDDKAGSADTMADTVDVADTVDPVDTGEDAALDAADTAAPADTTAFVCACDYGQRCVNACETPGDVCARDGYADGTERRYCRPPAELGEGCTNQFDEYYIACALGLLCLVPDPLEDDTVSLCYDCRPQEAAGVGDCEMVIGVFWDGVRCRSVSGCRCEGRDCEAAYPSVEACERAVGLPCSVLAPGR